MTKWHGYIGFGITKETSLDVYESIIEDHSYSGDVLRNYRKTESTNKVNDNINLSVQISVVANPFIFQHLGEIKYITYMGNKWKVTSADIQPPRIILEVGGIYNGE